MQDALLYFEDFVVGQEYQTGTYELSEKDIIEFAQKYDPQVFHTDPEAAKDTFFGGLAASGWQTAGITMRLQILCPVKVAGGMIGAGVEVTWPKPTRAGDILRVYNKVIEIKEIAKRPSHGFVLMQSETKNQHNEVLQRQVARLFVPKRNPI